MNIDEILSNIPNKFESRKTTTHKFKKDLFDFFNKEEFKERVCVEWGCYRGHTSRILSYLFKEVHGFDLDPSMAITFNSDRSNTKFYKQDFYSTPVSLKYGDVFFIDAVHTYEACKQDIFRSLGMQSNHKRYFILDDYGADPPVKKLVSDLVRDKKIEIVKLIGCSPTDTFVKPLYDYEGVICKEV